MLWHVTQIAFILHIGSGSIGLLSGIFSVTTAKGDALHRKAGNVFFVSMLVMSVFAIYLGFVEPGALVNPFIGAFVFYLVATGWTTIRRRPGQIGLAEKFGLVGAAVLFGPFMVLSIQLMLGLPTFFKSALPLEGPVLVAIYLFTTVLAIAVAGDLRVVFSGGISGVPRIARHLWRMCVALTLTTGSALTNGLPRIVPENDQVPGWSIYLQFIWIVLLIYWMVRVRLTGWFSNAGSNSKHKIQSSALHQ